MFRPSMGSYTPVPSNYDKKSPSKKSLDFAEQTDVHVSLIPNSDDENEEAATTVVWLTTKIIKSVIQKDAQP